jgi:hypothetical protein
MRSPDFKMLVLVAAATLLLTACPEDPTTLSGEVEVDDLVIDAGDEVVVEGDLTLTATGDVDISGRLAAPAGSGHTIAIEAAGTIRVAGELEAGSGAPGLAGGDLSVTSTGGDVSVEADALLASGDGGDGGDSQVGGAGGDLLLRRLINVGLALVVPEDNPPFEPGASQAHADQVASRVSRDRQQPTGGSFSVDLRPGVLFSALL